MNVGVLADLQDDAWDDDDDDFGGSDVGEFDYLSCEYLLPNAPWPTLRSANTHACTIAAMLIRRSLARRWWTQ